MRFEFPTDIGLAVPVAMAVLSLRLFRLARETRQLPEALVGLYFLLVPSAISLAIRVDRFDAADAPAVRIVSNGLFTVGGIALLLFAWCVFRRDARWAKALAWGGSALLVALWAGAIPAGGYTTGESFFLLMPSFASAFWVFFESLRYWRLSRRRQRIGLADPVVANRFLLFAIWTGSIALITMLGVAGALVQLRDGTFGDGGGLHDPRILAVTRVLAVAIAASIWLTFLAPARYHAWLRRQAAA